MKRKVFHAAATFALLLSFYMGADAQSVDTSQISKNNYFFISPLTLMDVINPALTIGYERNVSENFSFQIEGGPILKHSLIGYFFTGVGFGTRDAWWRNKGGKIRTEFKFYPENLSKTTSKQYYSVEFFMTRNSSDVTRLFTVSDPTFDYSNEDVRFFGSEVYRDFYMIHRNRYGVNFKIGLKEYDKNKITIDSSVGIGLAYQSATESGRTNYNDKPSYENRLFLKTGKRILPSITLGIKIGLQK